MGSIQSNITKQTLSAYTDVVNAVAVSVFNQAAQNCAAANTLTINTGQGGCFFQFLNGKINIDQIAGTNCKFNDQNIINLTSQFQNQLTTETQAFIQQNAQNKQGFIATALSLQINEADTVEKITNLISNSFQGSFTNICTATNQALNNASLNLCGIFDNSSIVVNQNAFVTAVTSCINEAVLNIFLKNEVLNKMATATDQKLYSQQEGIGSIFTVIFIIIGVLVVLGIIGGIIYALIRYRSPPKSQLNVNVNAPKEQIPT